MASTVKVKVSSPAVRALLNSSEVRDELHRDGDPVLSAMVAGCPVESGNLQASLQMWDDTTDRAVVRIGSDLGYAGAVEARTGFMARSLDAAGGA